MADCFVLWSCVLPSLVRFSVPEAQPDFTPGPFMHSSPNHSRWTDVTSLPLTLTPVPVQLPCRGGDALKTDGGDDSPSVEQDM